LGKFDVILTIFIETHISRTILSSWTNYPLPLFMLTNLTTISVTIRYCMYFKILFFLYKLWTVFTYQQTKLSLKLKLKLKLKLNLFFRHWTKIIT
jgi:hypothetical protein